MLQNINWKRVGITVRPGKTGVDHVTREISSFLLSQNIRVYVSGIPKDQLPRGIESCSLESLDVDLVITIGGDGTVLHTARQIRKDVPFFTVNFGSRGFLAESDPNHVLEDLKQILGHQYIIEEHMRLDVEIETDKRLKALNEVLITSSIPSKMIYLEFLVDNVHLWRGFADGVIFATPTGSTAHAASAGGALVDLRLEATVIVFISPLDFSMRPLVVPAASKIDIKLLEGGKDGLLVIDGQVQKPLRRGGFVHITKSQSPVKFLRLQKYSHLYRFSKLRKNLEKLID